MTRLLFFLFVFSCTLVFGQSDTLNGYLDKLTGEEITYYSPYHRFAKTALLTRCNGNSPISWNAPLASKKQKKVTYELLIGHSTGTSSGVRRFVVRLNGKELLVMTTYPKADGRQEWSCTSIDKVKAELQVLDHDVNQDAFGKLYITLPASLVKQQAQFEIQGADLQSRDWLMVFMYQKGFKIVAEPTQLVTRKENKRQLNIYIDQPFSTPQQLQIQSAHFDTTVLVTPGYNKLSLPVYPVTATGTDAVLFWLGTSQESARSDIRLEPIRSYRFCIVHHSHNDIGYSHLQTEVERIQTENIRSALRWIAGDQRTQQATWHIESLWAVENFLNEATPEEEAAFVQAVKSGTIVLSANYANVLTGLARSEELNWMMEYAKRLEKHYGFSIRNAMITDIPGISWAALNAYTENDISYLSLGPNYVETHADKGDRVGGVIREQGDKAFYWKPEPSSAKKLLVWTAGKGYSYFHNIRDNVKEEGWEQRITDYCLELDAENYPYEMVQLRYTKKADNGPVDTNLCTFIDQWNARFVSPQLELSSVDRLFSEFEQRYGATLPVETGEISPYWEDGAYSTAHEEMSNRVLSAKTSELEKRARKNGVYENHAEAFHALHRNIILFHEHTWGSWCSISDPEIFFTTEQWRIKKSFLDSAQAQYDRLKEVIGEPEIQLTPGKLAISDFEVDPKTGGLTKLIVNGIDIATKNATYPLFAPVYVLGTNTAAISTPDSCLVQTIMDAKNAKSVRVVTSLGSMSAISIIYLLNRNKKELLISYHIDKKVERNKESMHIALPFNFETSDISYGASDSLISLLHDQLPGSNREFICTEDKLVLISDSLRVTIESPMVNLFEVGGIINEQQVNGAKVWKRELGSLDELFLYVFNNYWHTNYKAYQDGTLDFGLRLTFE